MITEYLRSILIPLLTKPEKLSIDESEDDKGKLLSVRMDKVDMGKIIGKNGDTIRAIRSIIHIKSKQENTDVSIKILN